MVGAPLPPSRPRPRLRLLLLRRRRFCGGSRWEWVLGRERSLYMPPQNPSGPTKLLWAPWAGPN
jgi:hypothetical protein